jgi:cellulose synthase/poly-beta-1,6-N-acetylglucosamine synthase-like glycosyltransferase
VAEPSTTSQPSAAPQSAAAAVRPMVTVAMPVLNEEAFIARSLDQVLSQDYPSDRVEVVVADGMSSDRTREIVLEYGKKYPQVKLVDNPARFRANGLNVVIRDCEGEIVVCVDGHCEVASDFVRQGVELLDEHPEAWCVGGPTNHVGRNAFSKAVAIAMSHRLGVGTATHRFPNFEGYADGVQFPAYRKWLFDKVGLFDEVMVRTEDDELSFRIAKAGGKTYVSPRVKYQYYVRDSVRKLYQQYVQYAFWRIPVFKKHGRPTTVRQIVPTLFFLTMLILLVVGLALKQPLVAFALPVIYLGALVLVGLSVIPRAGLKVACLVPVAIATMHIAYAWGMAYGLFAWVFSPKAFDPSGGMSQQKR